MKKANGRPITHGFARRGMKRPKEYSSWDHMKRRCRDPKHFRYVIYGGKGITVCDKWFNSYEAFIKDVGPAPSPKHTIDRYPNKYGNYEPGNVRWATPTEQARNTSKNVFITYNGETLCIAEWAERFGMNRGVIKARFDKGLSPYEIFTNPIRVRKKQKAG